MPELRLPELTIDLRDRTLDLGERGLRVINPGTDEHVATILPMPDGTFDRHCWFEIVAAIRCYRQTGSAGEVVRCAA